MIRDQNASSVSAHDVRDGRFLAPPDKANNKRILLHVQKIKERERQRTLRAVMWRKEEVAEAHCHSPQAGSRAECRPLSDGQLGTRSAALCRGCCLLLSQCSVRSLRRSPWQLASSRLALVHPWSHTHSHTHCRPPLFRASLGAGARARHGRYRLRTGKRGESWPAGRGWNHAVCVFDVRRQCWT